MLKNIPHALGSDLLKVLMEMGHGDEIVIADGNFPAASNAKRLVRSCGLGVLDILDPVLQLFPLDTFEGPPVALMKVVKSDNYDPVIWAQFRTAITGHFSEFDDFEFLDRKAFYKRAQDAYAIVATSETARYGNIILRKGIL